MLLPLPLEDDNQIYIRMFYSRETEYYSRERQTRRSQNSIAELSIKHSISFYIILHYTRPRTRNKLFKIISVLTPLLTTTYKTTKKYKKF